MKLSLSSAAAAVTTLALLLAVSCATSPSPEATSWWAHVEVLGADDMEGRNTGSPGYQRAAQYVASEFEKAGAQPAAQDSYFQQVDFAWRQIREDECSLALVRGGQTHALELGAEANLSVGFDAAESVDAPVVFVGYGLHVPEIDHNDLAGANLKGKVVMYIRGAPSTLTGTLRAHAQKWEERWKIMRAAGAIGVVSVSNPKHTDVPWERSTLRRLAASMKLADKSLSESDGLQLSVRVNPDHAEQWFEGTGHTFDELLAIADEGGVLPSFPLKSAVRATVRYDNKTVQCMNVVGIVPGSDPELQKEYVVLSGHLDGLGIGGPIEGDEIYNGAMDNATGIASIIEIAKAVQSSGPPKRSLLLLAVTGEEKGLQGSKYFAKYPTIEGDIVANVNLDMFMPLVPFQRMVVYGLDESDLGDMIREVASRSGVEIQDDPQPERNIFIRSDQYNFVKAGVPALSFKFGFEEGSKAEQAFKDWIKTRYHAPSDDIDQPMDKEAAVAFTQMLLEFSSEIANMDGRPAWKDDSFFKRYAKDKSVAMR